MKKIILSALFISTILLVGAQDVSSCVDLAANLSRGAESKNVLALQNFLSVKGFLKARPNGYFGPATFAAVRAYQKSVGLSQVGNTGPATRAAIKKDSCSTSVAQPSVPSSDVASVVATTSGQISITTAPKQIMPKPTLDYIDMVTLFSGGQTDWNFNIYGANFSSTTNLVNFKNIANKNTYTIGTLPSVDGVTITIPKNITATSSPCGTGCNEPLPPGLYEVTVTTDGGQTLPRTIDIKSFVSSVQTASANAPLPASAFGIKFGTLTFSSSVPGIVQSIALNLVSSTISSGGVSGIVLKDESNGTIIPSTGTNMAISEIQSEIIGAYVNTSNTTPGTVVANFTIGMQDYVGKKVTNFTSPNFIVSVAGVL